MGKTGLARIQCCVDFREIQDILFELIRIESHEQAAALEQEVCDWIANYCRAEGIQAEKIEAPVGRYNLIARIPGQGDGPSLAERAFGYSSRIQHG